MLTDLSKVMVEGCRGGHHEMPRTDLLCAAGIRMRNYRIYIANQEIVRTNIEETERKTTVSKFSTPGRSDGRTEGWILGESVGDGASQDGESGNQSETASSFITHSLRSLARS